jgi:hypothetical protein
MNIDWIVDNTTYSLTDRTNFYHLKYDGFAHAPLHRLSERGPLQNGDTDRGYRLDPRIVTLKLGIFGTSETDFYSKRNTLNTIFMASDTAGELLFSYGSVERQLDCYCIEIAPGDRNHLWQEFVISLKANDPTWYDPTQIVTYFYVSGGSEKMEVPTVIPMTIGGSTVNQNEVITNGGDYEAFPTIRIDGPITGPTITNDDTGDTLDFTGTTINAGDWLDIDCRYGYKTVEDQDSANQISTLTDESDIATFSLGSGSNSITVTGTSATEATQVTIRYYERYIGV